MDRKALAPFTTLLLVLVVGFPACDLGQSGSEATPGDGDGSVTVPCPCDAEGVFLKVGVVSQEGEDVTLSVQEVIHGESAFETGAVFHATWDGVLPCYTGSTTVAVGDTGLAVYRESAHCDSDQSGAAGSNHSSCITSDSSGFKVSLTKWDDEILFASSSLGEISVPVDEIANLWTDMDCSGEYGDWSELLESAP